MKIANQYYRIVIVSVVAIAVFSITTKTIGNEPSFASLQIKLESSWWRNDSMALANCCHCHSLATGTYRIEKRYVLTFLI